MRDRACLLVMQLSSLHLKLRNASLPPTHKLKNIFLSQTKAYATPKIQTYLTPKIHNLFMAHGRRRARRREKKLARKQAYQNRVDRKTYSENIHSKCHAPRQDPLVEANTDGVPTSTTTQPSAQSLVSPQIQQTNIFPSEFGIYTSFFTRGITLARSREESKTAPLFRVSIFSSKPHMELRRNNDLRSPRMATATFHRLSPGTDICLSQPGETDVNIILQNREAFTLASSFVVPIRSGLMKSFRWKNSRGVEVASLHGYGHGAKLVRETTGQVVAAWTVASTRWRSHRKMAWIAASGGQDPREELGAWFELASVMTCMVIIELKRRQAAARSAAAASYQPH
ncbi:hypothetical protein GLAREA_07456 [Glarea lozoyensis ATCC 20868]|uniref:Uncharacterized protein n=1 Tax=Glarea lozoyensis (strain ATCC 20868 / MF5171) TaxID=1116229 RepID=S3E1H8_GLAL2|nr:uncharacterized protein GLAREA_07456 [Glarea lozoyensis ATCC 20868]EPE32323.1 hypothetical protein GLAREA_07456 [Glarea lozoyensis ATCC 20868]